MRVDKTQAGFCSAGAGDGGATAAERFCRSLNPCAKLLSLLIFLTCTVSFGKYDISGLVPLFALPLLGGAVLGVPFGAIFRRSLPALILVGFAGAANPFLDRRCVCEIFSLPISGGTVSLAVLLLKTFLCVSAALLFARCTPTNDISAALGKFKIPCVIVVQLMMTTRYLETISDEARRVVRAYLLRSPDSKFVEFRHFPHVITSLMLRSIDRAESVYRAMKCRGFDARAYRSKSLPVKISDILFAAVFCALCAFARFADPVRLWGGLFCG